VELNLYSPYILHGMDMGTLIFNCCSLNDLYNSTVYTASLCRMMY